MDSRHLLEKKVVSKREKNNDQDVAEKHWGPPFSLEPHVHLSGEALGSGPHPWEGDGERKARSLSRVRAGWGQEVDDIITHIFLIKECFPYKGMGVWARKVQRIWKYQQWEERSFPRQRSTPQKWASRGGEGCRACAVNQRCGGSKE